MKSLFYVARGIVFLFGLYVTANFCFIVIYLYSKREGSSIINFIKEGTVIAFLVPFIVFMIMAFASMEYVFIPIFRKIKGKKTTSEIPVDNGDMLK